MRHALILLLLALGACGNLKEAVDGPSLSPVSQSREALAMLSPGAVGTDVSRIPNSRASLWSNGRQSLLGDRRAIVRGDILTVVIQIDDKAEISNSTSRKRSGSEKMGIGSLFGAPERINPTLPNGASLDSAVGVNSSSSTAGDGSVRRKEKLLLRVAATVTEVLPNGILRIEGTQEVRVNYEIRELTISGYIRPEDISRQNEITYDKIASARISYGGRGFISEAQRPRAGQRLMDKLLPF